jgi:hypothetical protein
MVEEIKKLLEKEFPVPQTGPLFSKWRRRTPFLVKNPNATGLDIDL